MWDLYFPSMIPEICSGGSLFNCQSAGGWFPFILSKTRAGETIAQILPEPYAALLTGILLGVETGIAREQNERFNT